MDRRAFLHRAIAAGAGGAVVPQLQMVAARAQSATPGQGPYGPLATEPDENGLLLPDGFTSRIVGIAGEEVATTGYSWHAFPDGAATFPAEDGGWIHVCNSEVFSWMIADAGGVSAVRYDADGRIVDAYRILEGSNSNCAGGPTPWGTWLSGEENIEEKGRIWECDPTGATEAVAHPAMGLFAHEAAAVDETSETVYLTQDHPTGLFYRYTPTDYPDLSEGLLEAMAVAEDGSVTWLEVPDPSAAATPTREQVAGATRFNGGEGCWSHDGTIYFTTKGDHTVHALDITAQTHTVIWKGDPDRLGIEGAVLSGVDNITVNAGTGDLYVAEDGADMQVVMITPEGVVAPFAQVVGDGHAGSEVTGPCFNPTRDRLYFSSQRGPTTKKLSEIVPGLANEATVGGITYEVTGPFRGRAEAAISSTSSVPSPATTLERAANGSSDDDGDGGSGSTGVVIGGAVVLAAAAVGGALAVRRRAATPSASDEDHDPAE
ncbi:MAG: DUF839 domain-containing protein [Microthrixaceae bacterium]|nr:DUF839 domain-containing protein [Acidimicrobiales bacterium]MCB9404811.1 DUF839 domain-containing protein [Microthrixaceae bacterium]